MSNQILHIQVGLLDFDPIGSTWIPSQEQLDETRDRWQEVVPAHVKVIVTTIAEKPSILEVN